MSRPSEVESPVHASISANEAAFPPKAAFLFWLWWLLAIGVALLLRMPQLDQRPMHADEAVQAFKFNQLWSSNYYHYDRSEYHGPTLNYLSYPIVKMSAGFTGAALNEVQLRLVPVWFGVGLILLLPFWRDGLGRMALGWAAFFTAISPAMAFYSRYYIHEMLLVFFTLLALMAGWRYLLTGRLGWALWAGAALGCMYATKETFVLTLAAAGLAIGIVWLGHRYSATLGETGIIRPKLWHLGLAALLAAGISVLFFTSFLTNWQGPLDSVRSYLPWTSRAGGKSPHIHPWYFYLQHLLYSRQGRGPIWSEALVFGLAIVGILSAWFSSRPLPGVHRLLARFLAAYALVLMVIYSVIPYKTPWCLLSFWQGLILLAGIGAAQLLAWAPSLAWKSLVAGVLALGSIQLYTQANRACFDLSSDPQNPYVYSHTGDDLLDLVELVRKVAAANPEPSQTVVKVAVLGQDYWPLPWYLRDLRVGYYDQAPDDLSASMLIVSSRLAGPILEKPGNPFITVGSFGLRPRVILQFLVRKDLWENYQKNSGSARNDRGQVVRP